MPRIEIKVGWVLITTKSGKKANFEYGAVEVNAGKFAFPKGSKGNKELLKWHNKQQKKKNTINFFDY